MKRRVYKKYRTNKRGGQRYWVGRTMKENYGSQMFRDQIKKELYGNPERRATKLEYIKKSIKEDPLFKDAEFIEDPNIGSRDIIHAIEKNPDLLKDLRGSNILIYQSDKNIPFGFARSKEGVIGINKKVLDSSNVDFDPFTRSLRMFTPSNVLKHEVAHLRSGKILNDLGFNKTEKYDPIRERALAELASEYAMHTNIRKEKLPKIISDEMAFKFLSKGVNKPNPPA